MYLTVELSDPLLNINFQLIVVLEYLVLQLIHFSLFALKALYYLLRVLHNYINIAYNLLKLGISSSFVQFNLPFELLLHHH